MKSPAQELPTYENPLYAQFIVEAQAAGYAVEHYQGRWFYEGPAVFVEENEFQAVVRATTMPLLTDQMGKTGIVVYPVSKED